MHCADGVDYNQPTNVYQLNSGDTRQCVDAVIRNDALFEFPEIFTGQLVTVTDASNNIIPIGDDLTIDISETEVTILDNDREFLAYNLVCFGPNDP